ncbi:hypothetical protein EDEG_02276 [Edhazardia aedis USNM 41457]|uniref:GPI mannosyltransferase 2 n=1 Tax=Edhazardia aedis (strain USNM 41457) TaxID=1003232 RepID=J8ZUN2_EDHAE|nr:hypothetical protein EDEG_02276 [Edhazardia aedis USNM 41457]|eukprot:EJW03388.1 hypothetical protein EDEG_02276 [Edhazardia aedis USNM 41457]
MTLKRYCRLIALSTLFRIFYIILAKISHKTFESFDKSTNLIRPKYFEYLLRWDAVYFLEICTKWYYSEHHLAFFPLLPLLIKLILAIFSIENSCSSCLVTGVLVNNFLFVCNTVLLYKITKKRYDAYVAEVVSLFYMINPSSIIFSSFYSDSLYMFLFLTFFITLEKESKSMVNTILKCSSLALMSLTRSNSILNVLFFVRIPVDLNDLILNVAYILATVVPFILFQLYSYKTMKLDNFTVPYSYIQSNYWDQGFLKFYFDRKNIPNFLVGFPFVIFGLHSFFSFF